jgi:biopolymer transport protein ExbD
MISKNQKHTQIREQNFEVNILPTLDILSVLICFLLLTAIWVQMGYVPSQQVVETSPPRQSGDRSKALELHISFERLSLQFKVEGASQPFSKNLRAQASLAEISSVITYLHQVYPELRIAKIYPNSQTEYGRVVVLMHELRKNKITDLGLVPSGS